MTIEDVKIFIPTKGRPNKQKTYELLMSLGLKPVLVVEPQEEKFFIGKNYVVLPENDKGISFSRNWIMDFSRKNGYDYIVQIDDDVNSFWRKYGNRNKKDNKCFLDALKTFIEYKGYCGLEYKQISWCQNNEFSYNHSVEVCLMMYLPCIPEEIRFDSKSKEDKDFAIQLIIKGFETMKMNEFSFSVPTVGTNDGGLHDWYASKKDSDASYYMLEKWGKDIISIKFKNDGRIDAMVNWKAVLNKREWVGSDDTLF